MSTFSDVNADAGQEPASLVYDIDAINKSILAIFGTTRRTRPFRRAFGSLVNNLLFDPIDSRTAFALETEMPAAIKDWEPRVQILKVTVIPDQANEQYYVDINYRIPALSITTNLTFNLFK